MKYTILKPRQIVLTDAVSSAALSWQRWESQLLEGIPLPPVIVAPVNRGRQLAFIVLDGNPWHYHKGTNAPISQWQILAAEDLDAGWAVGPGGFGYGDGDDATVLSDMRYLYTTVLSARSLPSSRRWIRRPFCGW